MNPITSLRCCLLAIAMLGYVTSVQASSDAITIGQVNAQTGGAASIGKPLSIGAQVYIDSINAKGGIQGRKISLVQMDDQFKEALTAQHMEKLVANPKILAVINTLGAPNIDNLITSGFLQRHRLPVVGPLTNSTTARNRNSPYVFWIRASLQDEVRAMVKQVQILGLKRVAVFYQNDTSGLDGLELIKAELTSNNLKLAGIASYEKQDFKAERAAEIFQRLKPDIILSISVSSATSSLIRMMGRSISSGTMIIATSGNSPAAILKSLGSELSRGLGLVQVMPNLTNSGDSFIKEYRENFKKFAPTEDVSNAFSFEGYLSAKVLGEALAQIKGSPSRESLLQSLNSLKPIDMAGLKIDYRKNNRWGSSFAEVGVISESGRIAR